jgi:hypothetical protein
MRTKKEFMEVSKAELAVWFIGSIGNPLDGN